MKRFRTVVNVTIAAVMVLSATLLTSMRATAAPAQASVTLNLASWTTGTAEGVALKKLIASFEGKYKTIKINYQIINGDYPTVMKARLTSGTAPDVFYMNSDVAQDFIRTNTLMNLDFLKSDKSYGFNNLYKNLLAGYIWKGHVYGIPKDYSTLAMWYNKDLFSAAHISKPPTSWSQLQSDACKLTDKAKKQYGAVISADPARWLAFVKAAGGSLLNKNQTKATIDSAAGRTALDFYAGLVKKGCAALPSTVGAGWNGEAFGRTNGAIVFEGNWLTNVMQTTYPSVHWGVTALPKGPKGYGNLAFTAAYVMWAHTKHKSEATTLLKYLTGKDGETRWARLNGYIPSRKDSKPVAGTQVYIKAVKYSQEWFFPPGFARALTPIGNDIQKVMEGSMSTADAIKDMQSQSQTALSSP